MKTSRERFFTPRPRMGSYEELNAALRERIVAHAQSAAHPQFKDRTIFEVFEEERASLVAPQGPFRGFHETTAAVSKTCLITFDRNRYSVNAAAAGRPVQLRAYADTIVLLQDGAEVGRHRRVFGRDKTVYDPWHYVPVLKRKPGALRNGAPFKELVLPTAMTAIRARLSGTADGDRQMVDLLLAAREHGVAAMEQACAQALEGGLRSADAILNILYRQQQPKTPIEPIEPPARLTLTCEPVADCARYDRLAQGGDHGAR